MDIMPEKNWSPPAGGRRHPDAFRSIDLFTATMLLAAVTLGALTAAHVRAQSPRRTALGFRSPTSGNVVYVESNNPAGNTILAYLRDDSDGSLTPLPGSPYPTGGLGLNYTTALGPFDSDQEVIVNAAHTLLFAVNGGSDSISVFWIGKDGSLSPVDGSPFPSGGSDPVSVGLTDDDTLVVVNQDMDPNHPGRLLPNYTSFHVHRDGRLTPIRNSTFPVDAGSAPSQALISPDNDVMFGAEFLGGLLRTFQISENGQLTLGDVQPLPPSEFAGTGASPLPLGLAVHPRRNVLYVDFVTISRIGVYGYDDKGNLRFLRSVPDSGKAPCWALVNSAGTRLYASNTGDSSISVFDISGDATQPVEIQHLPLRTTGSCFQFKLDSTERFLHVVTQQSAAGQPASANALNVLRVSPDGTLAEVPSSPTILPVPPMVRPQGVAAL
jgi:6-phosphogluconolactonase (cycloisomerase 2 family)